MKLFTLFTLLLSFNASSNDISQEVVYDNNDLKKVVCIRASRLERYVIKTQKMWEDPMQVKIVRVGSKNGIRYEVSLDGQLEATCNNISFNQD